jgi:hypothetical protein
VAESNQKTMETLKEITDELFGNSSPGGKFLLSLLLLVIFNRYSKSFETKMDAIVKKQNPKLNSDDPFSRVLRKNTKVWTDAEWRSLNNRDSFFSVLSVVAIVSGAIFGIDCLILILGILLNW